MTPESIGFFSAAIVPASGSFILNLLLRGKDVLKSSGADWLLILFAFDLTLLFTTAEVAKFIPDIEVRASITPLALSYLVLTLVFWIFVVKYVEPLMASSTTGKKTAVISYGLTWLLIIVLTAAHIWIFLHNWR